MLSRWFGRRRASEAIATPAALEAALLGEANLITQKCLIGYCHARTLLPMNELMRDRVFAEAFAGARALAFAAVLADVVLAFESRLRAASPRGAEAGRGLGALYRRLLAAEPDIARRLDTAAAAAEFERIFERARRAAPKGPAEIAEHSGQRLFDTLPIHERLRRPDRDTVVASVRFMMMARFQMLDRRFAMDALVDALAADTRADAASP